MKKLILAAIVLLPVTAFGQAAVYQPPTPVAKLSKTPGAAASVGVGFATDENLRLQVVPQLGAATLAEVTPIAQSIMAITAVPTLFPVTPNALVNTAPLSAVRINNQFNIDMNCSYGAAAATPLPFTVPAQSQHYENFAANGGKMSSGVSCTKKAAATPASGELQVFGYTK